MNPLFVGSVNQYTKSLSRKTQWSIKKQTGDYGSHKKSLQDYVTFQKASDLLPDAEERDDRLSAIITKAQAGKKLSPDDWKYLEEKSPLLARQLRDAEREAKDYEEKLRHCKTKDEARNLHMSKLGELMAAAKEGDSSVQFRLNRLTHTMTKFTESEAYHALPTEAEQAMDAERERQEEREAMLEELERGREEQAAAAEKPETGEAENAAKTKASAHCPGAAEMKLRAAEELPGKTNQSASQSKEQKKLSLPSAENVPAAIVSGRQAYRKQQSRESDERTKRHKPVDTEA